MWEQKHILYLSTVHVIYCVLGYFQFMYANLKF